MSPSVLLVGKEGQKNATLLSSTSMESICYSGSELKERNYMALSDCSSVGSSTISLSVEDNKGSLNLKATELRLGFPGSESPERDPDLRLPCLAKLDEKPLFPLHPVKDGSYSFTQKTVVSGNKRVFSDAMDGFSEEKFLGNSKASVMLSPRSSNLNGKSGPTKENPGSQPAKMKEASQNVVKERSHVANENTVNCASAANSNGTSPATKAQVIGWPPIRSFRKNTLASTSKNADEVDGKAGLGALFVKVSMDGAPYLRKVDLKTYSTYQELSSALEKMFSCFTIGQYGSHGAPGREMLSESRLSDLLNGSEYVLTYEDKEGDWMLVGDVPWLMFIDTCRRLRIMKSSDAIGLAPRAVQNVGTGTSG